MTSIQQTASSKSFQIRPEAIQAPNFELHAACRQNQYVHSDWASLPNQGDHHWPFGCAQLKPQYLSFLNQKAVNLEQCCQQLHDYVSYCLPAWLESFCLHGLWSDYYLCCLPCIDFASWSDYYLGCLPHCVEPEGMSFEQMWKLQNNVESVFPSLSNVETFWAWEAHMLCWQAVAALNWCQRSVSSLIFFSHNAVVDSWN